ncbi:MAG TPA: hypothetical protein VJ970_07815, partial [Flavobacteriaceae bacterium]|nr:hypothetical protein [Flavobacteriaceae bacterium]
VVFTVSCKNNEEVDTTTENTDTIKTVSNKRITNKISEVLIPEARKAVADWKAYQELDDFILKYYNISQPDALAYADELAEMAGYLKDSVTVAKFKDPSFLTRLNVFYNETLRLKDMASIKTIGFDEVNMEVKKVLELYAAINSKINTIYKAEAIQKALEFDTEKPIIIKDKDSLKLRQDRRLVKPKISSKENISNK